MWKQTLVLAALFACLGGQPSTKAEEADQKLDLLEKEIASLKARLKELEKQAAELRQAKAKRILPAFIRPKTTLIPPWSSDAEKGMWPLQSMPVRRVNKDVDDVIRLQFEAPSQLFDGLREREQRLRHRRFPPDVIGIPRTGSGR